MKKQLTKEDLAKYLGGLPDSFFTGLENAGAYLKKKAIETVLEKGKERLEDASTFQSVVNKAFCWSPTEQGASFWASIYHAIPSDLGIEETPKFPEVKTGQRVLLKTIEEMRATSGVTIDRDGDMKYPDAPCFVHSMFPLAGNTILVGGVRTDNYFNSPGYTWSFHPWMVKKVIPNTPYIEDADDPRVEDLIGKRVYCSDSIEGIMQDDCYSAVLRGVTSDGSLPFCMPLSYKYIREITEVREVTMAEVCKQFGQEVKIRKE